MTNWAPDATSIWGRCTSLAPLSRQCEVAGCSTVGYPPLAHHIRLLQQTSYIHLNAESYICHCKSSSGRISSTSVLCHSQPFFFSVQYTMQQSHYTLNTSGNIWVSFWFYDFVVNLNLVRKNYCKCRLLKCLIAGSHLVSCEMLFLN